MLMPEKKRGSGGKRVEGEALGCASCAAQNMGHWLGWAWGHTARMLLQMHRQGLRARQKLSALQHTLSPQKPALSCTLTQSVLWFWLRAVAVVPGWLRLHFCFLSRHLPRLLRMPHRAWRCHCGFDSRPPSHEPFRSLFIPTGADIVPLSIRQEPRASSYGT